MLGTECDSLTEYLKLLFFLLLVALSITITEKLSRSYFLYFRLTIPLILFPNEIPQTLFLILALYTFAIAFRISYCLFNRLLYAFLLIHLLLSFLAPSFLLIWSTPLHLLIVIVYLSNCRISVYDIIALGQD